MGGCIASLNDGIYDGHQIYIGEVVLGSFKIPREFLENFYMRKVVSIKLTLEEWDSLIDEYREFLMTHHIPVSKHKYMKFKILGSKVFDVST
jgi:hypothetical protein